MIDKDALIERLTQERDETFSGCDRLTSPQQFDRVRRKHERRHRANA